MVDDTTAAHHLNGKHPKIGAVVGLLMGVQVAGGFVRPQAPKQVNINTLSLVCFKLNGSLGEVAFVIQFFSFGHRRIHRKQSVTFLM